MSTDATDVYRWQRASESPKEEQGQEMKGHTNVVDDYCLKGEGL